MNYKQITTTIISLEKKNNLFSLQQNGIYIWKLIRIPVMTFLVTKVNNIESIHGKNKEKEKWLNLVQGVKNSILKNPFFANKNVPKIVLENPRKIKWNNELIDPYTHFFLRELEDYHVIEDMYKFKQTKSVYSPSSSTYFLLLCQQIRKITSNQQLLSDRNTNALERVEQQLQKELNIEVPIKKMALKQYNTFLASYFVYSLLFKKKKWKEIFLVCSYGKESIIAAAQENNIIVKELQHGVMGSHHLGYHFPETENVPYFPDELLLFGGFWKDTTALPPNTKVSLYGYPYLNEQLKCYEKKIKCKNKKVITVISQGTIGKALSEFMLKVVKELPNYHFQYKLHPGEYNRWKTDYPCLIKLSEFKNVTIYEDKKPLYEILAESMYSIGVYSTALFEAVAFETYPLIIKLPGYEYMDVFRKNSQTELFEDPSDIIYLLNNPTSITWDFNYSDYLFYGSMINKSK